jgi:hydrogenase nickel incorporation protein HypB
MGKKIQLGTKILSANEEYAQQNSKLLREKGKYCLNMISSPGSGKTTILTRTITDLKGKLKIGVIEGDIQTQLDTDRIRATEAPAVQINTYGSCHLSAAQVNSALAKLPLAEIDLVFIENVGNLVCPSVFELGEDGKVVVLSVAEGDDKPAKYPAIFSKSKALLINKIDMLSSGAVDFEVEKVEADTHRLNKDIRTFCVSAKTGQGMEGWYDWLIKTVGKSG